MDAVFTHTAVDAVFVKCSQHRRNLSASLSHHGSEEKVKNRGSPNRDLSQRDKKGESIDFGDADAK